MAPGEPQRFDKSPSDVTHDRFYWLRRPVGETVAKGQEVRASVEGQRIVVEASEGGFANAAGGGD